MVYGETKTKKQQENNSKIERQRNTCLCNEHGIYVAEIMFKSFKEQPLNSKWHKRTRKNNRKKQQKRDEFKCKSNFGCIHKFVLSIISNSECVTIWGYVVFKTMPEL